MKCRRCNGLLVKDRLYDLYDTHVHLDAWRCLACGDVFDAVILHNRMNRITRRAGDLSIGSWCNGRGAETITGVL